MVTNHIGENYEYLLFCNNDIVLLNNVIYEMVKTFKTNPTCGTVGARLHYGDNTIQHDGIFIYLKQSDKTIITVHKNKYNYYNFSLGTNSVIGNTAALMMVNRKVFIKQGMFDENYRHCFEDVDLNIKIKSSGIINKFFEIGLTLNIFKLYSSLFKNLTPLKSDVIETSKLSSKCLYIMVAGIT